jgi:hypothetical protein
MGLPAFLKRDDKGLIIKMSVINKVAEILRQVAVADAVSQAPTPTAELRIIRVAASIYEQGGPLASARGAVFCGLNCRGER